MNAVFQSEFPHHINILGFCMSYEDDYALVPFQIVDSILETAATFLNMMEYTQASREKCFYKLINCIPIHELIHVYSDCTEEQIFKATDYLLQL